MGLIVISGSSFLFPRFSPTANWSHLFSNINRKMEFAQKDCSENGDDGGCEARVVSTAFMVLGLKFWTDNFFAEQITKKM